jgi:hypothetical protein
MKHLAHIAVLTAAVALGIVFDAAHAEVHEQSFGRYVVRADVTHTQSVPRDVLERHRVKSAPDRALLEVVVRRHTASAPKTVRATVTATAREPSGRVLDIEMFPVAVGERVSFLGLVPISAPQSMLEFIVQVLPEDDLGLRMEFSDTVTQRSKP